MLHPIIDMMWNFGVLPPELPYNIIFPNFEYITPPTTNFAVLRVRNVTIQTKKKDMKFED